MAIFAVIATRDPEIVGASIAALPEGEATSLPITADTWLVAFEGTTKALAEKIGFLGEAPTSVGLILAIQNYSGRANPDIWEWLKVNLTKKS